MTVRVTELREPTSQPSAIGGTHLFRIRIRNNGTEPFTVRTITIEPAGMAAADFDAGPQTFNDTIAPGVWNPKGKRS